MDIWELDNIFIWKEINQRFIDKIDFGSGMIYFKDEIL